MAGKEGLLGKYRNFSEITRNVGIGVFALAWFAGWHGIATVAALSVIIDLGQIMLIDKWQNRKK